MNCKPVDFAAKKKSKEVMNYTFPPSGPSVRWTSDVISIVEYGFEVIQQELAHVNTAERLAQDIVGARAQLLREPNLDLLKFHEMLVNLKVMHLKPVCACTAQFAYHAVMDGEISFEVGDPIDVMKKHENGWWEGRLQDGRVGLFPENHVVIKQI